MKIHVNTSMSAELNTHLCGEELRNHSCPDELNYGLLFRLKNSKKDI